MLRNLGPNFSRDMVIHINKLLDVKEELFHRSRESQGVRIRSGRHNPRSDEKDYCIIFQHLTDTMAHRQILGRKFGNYKYPENIMDDERFCVAGFYRWLITKNEEAAKVLKAKNCD